VDNVAAADLPGTHDVPALLGAVGQYRPPDDGLEPCGWARVVLPLALDGRSTGFWLLGRRPPDDYYALAEVAALRSLAQQTAIALNHIAQTERIRRLYQANVNQREAERTRVARELHDDVLSGLADLMVHLGDPVVSDNQSRLQAVVDRIRASISDLRPAVLDHGLWQALAHLGDQLDDAAAGKFAVLVEIPPSEARYDSQSEQHLYRIVQQACDNALAYAQAHVVRLQGELGRDQVTLSVEDDGAGFALDPAIGIEQHLSLLVQAGHYGLANVMERALLIGAELRLDSSQGQGTRLHITWRPKIAPA
jgi:signal transduction histidine kinase